MTFFSRFTARHPALSIVLIVVLFGIVGRMDYEDAVRIEQKTGNLAQSMS